MTCFYFSSVPKLKIRRGGVVDDFIPLPPVSSTTSILEIAVPQAPEAMVSISPSVMLAPKITAEVPFVPLFNRPASSSKNFRRSGKRKVVVDSKGETVVPGRGMDDAKDFGRAGLGREHPSSRVEDRVPHD
ncbi:hypothetical protein Fot_06985 [Forsythia ovata]|uniref:Uncharacterized protein n=1 Tax=Forsythia ovata TaxID=205694 RepID=A0ABD1WUJ1_9LAMI